MAKVISFQIPKSQQEFVRFQEDRGRHFYDKLHQHPQLQLTVILEGKGQFFSGDFVGRFQAGDVYFLGENAPHVFRSDPEYFEVESELNSSGNTIFFDFAVLGKALGELEDLQSLRKFKDFTGSCFQIFGESKNEILEIFEDFPGSSGLIRFQLAIKLLSILDRSGENLLALNRPTLMRGLSERDGKRMDQVMQFLLENRFGQITLEETAEKANLSKEAFCRFFKLRTRKTFTQYVLQLRINEAQKLLEETDLGISEIAFKVGFENLSYFNRSFKAILGKSPREFRK
ncbi:AraC family transcriptional regulator [Algoriphagus sp. A40]|uniref:helix-turn-helix domain-containing protein n=1 Tax=Algoriphagus sp. A40 TaxID=1945863 RepID=UPI00098651CE|nr:AraC family transcriptional regulator [Algoriphagus sp. A40]OOG69430.1 AraC family transcriptional regulator [Algoriphagus sp. A40]